MRDEESAEGGVRCPVVPNGAGRRIGAEYSEVDNHLQEREKQRFVL